MAIENFQFYPKFVLFILLILFTLNACSFHSDQAGHSEQTGPSYKMKKAESLQQIIIENKQIKFNAISTGCTNSNDFIVESEIIDQQCQLTIYRIEPDLCRRAPQTIAINLSWDKATQCKQLSIQVLNPQAEIPKIPKIPKIIVQPK